MNDLSEAYSIYPSADKILELLVSSKIKKVKRTSLKTSPYWDIALKILISYEFIFIEGTGKQQTIKITEKGVEHLKAGGFGTNFSPLSKEEKKKTFKQHLDDLVGLLTIFGILNTVILFAIQVKSSNAFNKHDLNVTGVEFISISMYLLSLVVLWEIIWTTLNEIQDSLKFKALYYLLCCTTIGVGLVFLNQYNKFIYGGILLLTFFVVTGAIVWLFLKILSLFVNKKNASWLSKRSNNISFILLIISMISAAMLIKQFLYVIKNWF